MLVENIGLLYVIQGVNYLVPFFVTAYLVRVLGPSVWGQAAVAEAFGRYAMLAVEYGFQLSGGRETAAAREDARLRGVIFGRVFGAQLGLAAAVLGLAAGLVWGIQNWPWYLLAAAVWGVGIGLSPLWYFVSVERVRAAALVECSGRVLAALAVVWWVRSAGDLAFYFVIQACGVLGVMGAQVWMVSRQVNIVFPGVREVGRTLREGFALFLFRGAVSVYTFGNVILLSMFVRPEAVGIYAGAERMMRAGIGILQPVGQALFPRMAYLVARERERAARVMGGPVLGMLGLAGVLSVALWVGADAITRVYLGAGFEESARVLRWLAPVVGAVGLSTILGLQIMVPLRMDRWMAGIIAGGALMNVALAAVLAPRFSAAGMAMAVMTTEVGIAVAMGMAVRRVK